MPKDPKHNNLEYHSYREPQCRYCESEHVLMTQALSTNTQTEGDTVWWCPECGVMCVITENEFGLKEEWTLSAQQRRNKVVLKR